MFLSRIGTLTNKLLAKFPICVNLDQSCTDCNPIVISTSGSPYIPYNGPIPEEDVIQIGRSDFWKRGFSLYNPRYVKDSGTSNPHVKVLILP